VELRLVLQFFQSRHGGWWDSWASLWQSISTRHESDEDGAKASIGGGWKEKGEGGGGGGGGGEV
jgi:hypothetical protein